jgi:ATPase family protein associated with various cellular activities (AAA)
MKRNTIYLKFRNLDAETALEWYGRQVHQYASYLTKQIEHEPVGTRADIDRFLRQAQGMFGLRCRALEIFAERTPISPDSLRRDASMLCEIIALIAGEQSATAVARLRELLQDCATRYPNLQNNFVVAWSRDWESAGARDSAYWLCYAQSAGRPWLQFDSPKFEAFVRAPQEPIVHRPPPVLTRSQQAAATKLQLLYKAKRSGLSAGGITPSLHPLLIGSSGSGKSFLVRSLAKRLKIPLFETTMSSWLPQGGRAQVPTGRQLARFLQDQGSDGAIVFVDEIDKLRSQQDNSEYGRHLLDEVMALLSGIVERWDGWSPETVQILRDKTFIISAGTFQHMYQDQASQSPGEAWQQMSIADRIWEQKCLPEELLMRLSSSMIELQAPDHEEIVARLMKIHVDMGVAMMLTPEELSAVASGILRGRCNMRGLQTYITDIWMEQQARKVRSAQTALFPVARETPFAVAAPPLQTAA